MEVTDSRQVFEETEEAFLALQSHDPSRNSRKGRLPWAMNAEDPHLNGGCLVIVSIYRGSPKDATNRLLGSSKSAGFVFAILAKCGSET